MANVVPQRGRAERGIEVYYETVRVGHGSWVASSRETYAALDQVRPRLGIVRRVVHLTTSDRTIVSFSICKMSRRDA